VIAKTDIPIGTIILTEAPIFLVPDIDYPEPVLQTLLTSQLNPPSPNSTLPSLNTFHALADAYADPPHRKTIKGIVRTNGYPAEGAIVPNDGTGRGGLPAAGGVFPNIARFNSDCTPNVTHRYDSEDGRRTVFAARAIGEGEELVTCYVDPTVESGMRRACLKERFRFDCECAACHGDGVAEHDQRRRKISSLDDEIFDRIRSGKYGPALEAIEARIDLLREENLDSPEFLLRTYHDGYQCCDHAGDRFGALGYLRKVYRMQGMCDASRSRLEEVGARIRRLEEETAAASDRA